MFLIVARHLSILHVFFLRHRFFSNLKCVAIEKSAITVRECSSSSDLENRTIPPYVNSLRSLYPYNCRISLRKLITKVPY